MAAAMPETCSRLALINTNPGRSLAESRHSEIELVQVQRVQTSARTGRRGNFLQQFVVIDVALLDHVNKSLAAGGVNSPAHPVVKQVIGVAGQGKVRDPLAVLRVEDDQSRR